MKEDQELLSVLARRTGSGYLSDLHAAPYLLHALQAALETGPGEYPLSQWQDAAAYLLGWTEPLQSEAEARDLLAQRAGELRQNG